MTKDKICFTAVEYPDDPNVVGYYYWYICNFADVAEGDKVVAPLGRHDSLQQGIVRRVIFADESNAPYPVHSIKYIKKVIKYKKEDNV